MMKFNKITSKDNSLIKLISSLQTQSKKRNEHGMFVLEGLRICTDAMDNGIMFDKLIVSETAYKKLSDEIEKLSENASECFVVSDLLVKKISDTQSPQGILAVCKKSDVIDYKIDPNGKYIALENIADPSNLGAVARTVEALGLSGIILSSSGVDPYSPKALRASMGTLLRLPVIIIKDMTEFVRNTKLSCFACVVDRKATPITDVKFMQGSIVLIGNEANGLLKETADACAQKITIPMSGKAESLNASVAASIAMWELIK